MNFDEEKEKMRDFIAKRLRKLAKNPEYVPNKNRWKTATNGVPKIAGSLKITPKSAKSSKVVNSHE